MGVDTTQIQVMKEQGGSLIPLFWRSGEETWSGGQRRTPNRRGLGGCVGTELGSSNTDGSIVRKE